MSDADRLDKMLAGSRPWRGRRVEPLLSIASEVTQALTPAPLPVATRSALLQRAMVLARPHQRGARRRRVLLGGAAALGFAAVGYAVAHQRRAQATA
jgi:hypothetical protein